MGNFRVRLWDKGTNFGRGNLSAVIDDAANIGVASYANDGGEFFMTLPWNHPAIRSSLDPSTLVQGPLLSHYEVSRRDPATGTYTVVGTGILDGVQVGPEEMVVYGRDYLSLLDTTISSSNTSYTNTAIGTIISDQLTQARGETSSRVNFISMGTISATSTTATMLTSYQSRLEFIGQAIDVYRSNTVNRPIISVSPRSSGTPSFNFEPNAGSDKTDVRLEYGGNVTDFLVVPNFQNFRTRVKAVGQKRDGSTLLFSNQSYALESTYGAISEAALFYDVINQSALDALALRRARQLGNAEAVGQSIKVAVNQLGPFDGYDLADSIRLHIDRAGADFNGFDYISALYTVWGLEWVGLADGSEELFLDLLVKETSATPPVALPLIASNVQVFAPTVAGANRISNGGFEIDLAGWATTATNFHSALDGTGTRSSTRAYAGTYSYHIQGNTNTSTTPPTGVHYAISGTFTSGVTYTVTAHVYNASSAMSETLMIGSSGTTTDNAYAGTSTSGSWETIQFTWVPTANRTDVHFTIRFKGGGGGGGTSFDYYLDEVSVT